MTHFNEDETYDGPGYSELPFDSTEDNSEFDGAHFDDFPMEPFDASYTLNGKVYDVRIKGFMPADSNVGKYRVTYEDGTVRIIGYLTNVGWIKDGKGNWVHAREIGRLIQEHFS